MPPFPRTLLLTLLALFILPFPTHAQETFQLVTPSTGWYLSNHRIFYTTDSGVTWSDISPIENGSTIPLPIVTVHFRDARNGWALILVGSGSRPDCEHGLGLDFASTTDAGAHWRRRAIPIPSGTLCSVGFSIRGEIFFLDSAHGWVNLAFKSYTDPPASLLLYTTDAGITWHQSPDHSCGPGPLLFTSSQDGWSLSDDMHQLCVTHDGGKTFNPEKLPFAHLNEGDIASYSLPTFFTDQVVGFIPITYAYPLYDVHHFQGALVVFETRDGGHSWRKSMQFGSFYMDDSIGTSIAGNQIFFLTPGDGKYCIRLGQAMTHGGGGFQYTTKILNTTLSFVDRLNGWVYLEGVGLISTHDAGQTWTNITPQTVPLMPVLHPHTNLEE